MATAHRNIKRLTLWIVGAVIGFPLLLFLFFVVGSTFPGGDGGVVSVADRLKPESDWVLEDESIVPDTWINLGDVSDPRISRIWQTPGNNKEEVLLRVINAINDDQSNVTVECYREGIDSWCGGDFVTQSDGGDFKVFVTAKLHPTGVMLGIIVEKI